MSDPEHPERLVDPESSEAHERRLVTGWPDGVGTQPADVDGRVAGRRRREAER